MSAWWSSLGFGKAEQPAETDYADMGTAFGLDASFSRHDDDAFPAIPERDAATAGTSSSGRAPRD